MLNGVGFLITTMKIAIISFLIVCSSLFAKANAAEQWQCALDLQQGDRGSMTLERSGSALTGIINIDRNGSEFSQEVEGRWLDQEVELKRFLNSTSNEEMIGIAIRVGTSQVKMGGRYAEGLTGVWSADCDLVAGEVVDASEPVQQSASRPSVSARTTPAKPGSGDKIKFSAQAFHADGIESITFFINDKSIHECKNEECTVSHGPLKPGAYQWHVIAKSKNGTNNTKRLNQLVINSSASLGHCDISGIATGPAVARSADVALELIPNKNSSQAVKSSNFDAGTYYFNRVPSGSYLLSIDVPESLGILVSPDVKQVSCEADGKVQQNFQFN